MPLTFNPNFESSLRHTPAGSHDYAVAVANEHLQDALRNIRKAALIEDVKFERMAVRRTTQDGDILDGTIFFGMKISASLPSHRSTITVPVFIREGEVCAPTQFEDSTARRHPLTAEGVEQHLGTAMTDYRQLKRLPRVDLSLTDRTVLPTLPARNFFSLAHRHRSAGPGVPNMAQDPQGNYGADTPEEDDRIVPGDEITDLDAGGVAHVRDEDGEIRHVDLEGELSEVFEDNLVVRTAENEDDDEDLVEATAFGEGTRLGSDNTNPGSVAPTFDGTADHMEERWIEHEDPTTSARTAQAPGELWTHEFHGGKYEILSVEDFTVRYRDLETGEEGQTELDLWHEQGMVPLRQSGARLSGLGMSLANGTDGEQDLLIDGEPVDPEDLTGWASYEKTVPTDMVQIDAPFEVETLEGTMTADAGDFLARGPEGELYPVDEDIQAKTFREV